MKHFISNEERMFTKAMKIATDAHEGQVDKANVPYIIHIFAVISGVSNDFIDMTIAALHDVVEDTNWTIDELRKTGSFTEEVLEAVALLTRSKTEKYESYIIKIGSNKRAIRVKLSDLTHNMDERRNNSKPTENDIKRREKYKSSFLYLKNLE